MQMSKKIFVTGATGFIGSKFVQHAVKAGYRLRVLSRNLDEFRNEDFIEVYQGDLTGGADWSEALSDVDVVVNAAGEIRHNDLMQSINFDEPLRLFNASVKAGVRRWVQLSSVGAYGRFRKGVIDESWNDSPVGQYEKTKSDFDSALMEASTASNIDFCILRPSNVYGHGMRVQSIYEMLNVIRKGQFAFIGPEGPSANYVHVDDVAHAILLCVSNHNAANQIYIVSAWATIEDMVSGLAEGAGCKAPNRRIPFPLAKGLASFVKIWPKWPLTTSRVQALSSRSQYSTRKIERELCWKCTVPVKEGMRQFAKRSHK